MANVNFNDLKARVGVEDVASMLGLNLKRDGQAWRSPCPYCQRGGDRAIIITPAREAFYCHYAAKGGDCISLAAHVMGTGVRDAAQAIADHYRIDTAPKPAERPSKAPEATNGTFDPAKVLSTLRYDDEELAGMGLDESQARELGIGRKAKGKFAGKIVAPIYRGGQIVGFAGVEGRLHFPETF